jgi:uncharacterized protein (DUF2236 family)
MAERSISEARGLFGPDSMIWRVNREAAVALAGTCAILMQFAHPKVAAGVRDHSQFEADPAGRLRRTFDLTLAWVFGSYEEAMTAARVVNRRHDAVRGPDYSAKDPGLLLWVQATLVYSAIEGYRALVGRLTADEADSYYKDTREIGALLGVPAELYPSNVAGLFDYMNGMMSSGQVSVGEDARRMASVVMQPRFPGVPRMAFTPLRTITAGLLPEELRRQYGMKWGRAERLTFTAYRAMLPRLISIAPKPIRYLPPARQAYRRLGLQAA